MSLLSLLDTGFSQRFFADIESGHFFKALKSPRRLQNITSLTICSQDQLDRSEPRNAGVVSDHLVGTSNGVMLRRIVYTNPGDGVA